MDYKKKYLKYKNKYYRLKQVHVGGADDNYKQKRMNNKTYNVALIEIRKLIEKLNIDHEHLTILFEYFKLPDNKTVYSAINELFTLQQSDDTPLYLVEFMNFIDILHSHYEKYIEKLATTQRDNMIYFTKAFIQMDRDMEILRSKYYFIDHVITQRIGETKDKLCFLIKKMGEKIQEKLTNEK
jgi:hypothetical protein